MAEIMVMRKNTKGFYTLEAAIMLPLVILAILSLGYFIKVDAAWENCFHIVIDECSKSAASSYPAGVAVINKENIEKRILSETSEIDSAEIANVVTGFNDMNSNKLTACKIKANMKLNLPAGFSREFNFESKVKFRGFVGKQTINTPMGSEGLEKEVVQNPVSIFPLSGEKYHSPNCTYVKATVTQEVLTNQLKKNYSSCSLCNSKEISTGNIVFCFKGENTAYHRGTCSTIDRHTAIIDKADAIKRGYIPCTKCGG